jgi:hypothetical protein
MGMMRIRSQTIRNDVNVLNYVIFVHAALYYCIIAIEILRDFRFKQMFVWICLYSGIKCYYSPPSPPPNNVDDVTYLIILTV